jgi:CubicO group peptidase (beta-lactamase class C family)
MSRHCLPLTIVLVVGSTATRSGAQPPPRPLVGLDRYVEATMGDWGIPGLSVAVVKGDSVIYARGFGVLRIGEPARVTPETMFAIGSISKSFTAAALAMLVDQGKIRWDDPVGTRLPGFALADPVASSGTTIRDLLSHRTGLPGENTVFWGSDVPRAEIVRRIRFLPVRAPPRTQFEYQNLAFVAAGEVVPAMTGKSWDHFISERIFGPLGMARATTSVGTLSQFNNVASPHAPIDGRTQPIGWLNLDNAGAAGSIVASALEMTKYLRLQLGKGTYEGKRILSDSVVRQMHSGSTIVPLESSIAPAFPDAHFIEYGLGWFRQDYHDHLIIQHGGQTDGMHANLAFMPELGVGLVVLTNSVMFGYPAAISYRVFDAFLNRPERDWSAEVRRSLAGFNPSGERGPTPIPNTTPSIPTAELVGRYHQDYLGEALVSHEGDQLQLSMLGRKVKLAHWHYDTYRPDWTDALLRGVLGRLTFERDGQGRVARLRFDGSGGVFARRR